MKTLSDHPFLIRDLLARNARRAARRNRWRRLFVRQKSNVHTAHLGRETIESNLPLR
jgi:hypothetical protein